MSESALPPPPLSPALSLTASNSFLESTLINSSSSSSSSSSNSTFSYQAPSIEKKENQLDTNYNNNSTTTGTEDRDEKEDENDEKNDAFFSFLPALEPNTLTEPTLSPQPFTTSLSPDSSITQLNSTSTVSPLSSPTEKNSVTLSKESLPSITETSSVPPRKTHFELRAETERLLRAQKVALPSQTVKRSLEEFLEKRKKAKLSSKDTSASSNLSLKSIMVELSDSDSEEESIILNSHSSSSKLKKKTNLSTLEHQKILRLKMIQQAQLKRKGHRSQENNLSDPNASLNDVKNEFSNMVEDVSNRNRSDEDNDEEEDDDDDDDDDEEEEDIGSESYGSMLSSDYDDSDGMEEEIDDEEVEVKEEQAEQMEEPINDFKQHDIPPSIPLITYDRVKDEDEDMGTPSTSYHLPFTPIKSTSHFTSTTHSSNPLPPSLSTPSQIQMNTEDENVEEEDLEDVPRIPRLYRSRRSLPSTFPSSSALSPSSNSNTFNWDTFFVASPPPDTSLSPTSKLNQLRQQPTSPTLVPSFYTDASLSINTSLPPSPSPPVIDATAAAAKFFLDTEAVESDDEDTLFPFSLNSKEGNGHGGDENEEEDDEDEDKDLEGFVTQDQPSVDSDSIRALVVQQRQEEQQTWLNQLEKDLDLKQQRRLVNANSRWTSSSKKDTHSDDLHASFLSLSSDLNATSALDDFTSTLSITTPSPNTRARPFSSVPSSMHPFPSIPSSPSSSFPSHLKRTLPMSPTPSTPSLTSSINARRHVPSLPSKPFMKGSFLGKRFDTRTPHPTSTSTASSSSSASSSSFSSTTSLSIDSTTSGFQTSSFTLTTGTTNSILPPLSESSLGALSNSSHLTKTLGSQSNLLKVLEDTNES